MKAIIYTNYGSPDVLRISEVPAPTPAKNEVLIRVLAAEATKADCELRSFRFPVKWFWLPLRIALGIRKPRRPILGSYFSGTIDTIGENVTTFKKGDKVFGCAGLRMGAYGEYMTLPEKYTIVPVPKQVTFDEAAAVPLGGLNAIHFMRKADIKSGEHVLINGAGGSIGAFAVQIAKTMGAEVTGVDSGIKEDMVRSIGADHFIDYSTHSFTEQGRTYDVIFDMVARKSYGACMRSLRPGGRYLMGNPRFSDMLRAVASTWFTNKTVRFAFAGEKREELLALSDMLERGEIRSPVDQVFPMEEAAAAHRRVESETRLGCVVLSLAPTI